MNPWEQAKNWFSRRSLLPFPEVADHLKPALDRGRGAAQQENEECPPTPLIATVGLENYLTEQMGAADEE